jgi:hypothetical protein
MHARNSGFAASGRMSGGDWMNERHERRAISGAKKRSTRSGSSGRYDPFSRMKGKLAEFRRMHPGLAPRKKLNPGYDGFHWKLYANGVEITIFVGLMIRVSLVGYPEKVGEFCTNHHVDLKDLHTNDRVSKIPQTGEQIRTIEFEPFLGSKALNEMAKTIQEK